MWTLSSRAQSFGFERGSTRAMFQANSCHGIDKTATRTANRYPPTGLHWNPKYRLLRSESLRKGCDHPDGRANQVKRELRWIIAWIRGRTEMGVSTTRCEQVYMQSICVKKREMWQKNRPHAQKSFEPRRKYVFCVKVGSGSARPIAFLWSVH